LTVHARSQPAAELEELKAYLGPKYDSARLAGHQRAVEEELAGIGDEDQLYRRSQAYLYDLTVFAMSQTKEPYLRDLAAHLPPGARLLDYGCGIGSDGLRLLESGYDVAFADFDNPSVQYLRWRLARRGLEAEIFDIDRPGMPRDFDLAYAFDVIEHVDDPFDLLARMEGLARHVLVNFLEPAPNETSLHRPLPVKALLRYVATRRLMHYRVYHGRSHLVLYETAPARPLHRARSRLRLLRGRIARR
jgi:SAM-dependent methyltransferase